MNEILMKKYRIKILPVEGARFAHFDNLVPRKALGTRLVGCEIINIPRIAQDVSEN